MANPMDPVLSTLPKKGNLQQCQNYRTISLISHPSKVMLKIILNRLKPQAEKIITEEQAGFGAGRNTTEQIFNLRILCEKYLQHQQELYHVFIDFKKAFDRVWHAALWATMKKYNISTNLIQVIKNLYYKAISAVLSNSMYRRLVPNNSWSPTGMSILTHPLQHISGKDHDRCLMVWYITVTETSPPDRYDNPVKSSPTTELIGRKVTLL